MTLRRPAIAVLILPSLAIGAPLLIGTRLEPFVDRFLIDELHDVALTPGTPEYEGAVLRFDEPWEGNFAGYITVLKDGGKYRMYYRGWPTDKAESVTCYAESGDGRQWRKPALGLHAHGSRKDTNIILPGAMRHITSDFAPFIDANPAARPGEKFKAVGGTSRTGLFALSSADGTNWKLLHDQPIFREGAFDSQNVPFWSETEGLYVLYFRVFTERNETFRGYRTISRTTSKDFIHWSAPERMQFAGHAPEEHLYTNQTHPYYRAKHIYLSFPMRLVPERQLLGAEEARTLQVFPDREKSISDGVFMTSRGGTTYDRTFGTAFFRPGPDRKMWVARNSMAALGVVPLGGGRMGIYRQHHYASLTNHLVLYSLREDGLASLRGGVEEGHVITRPFTHAGNGLWLNYATSAAGSIKVEALDADGKAIAGFSGGESRPQFGDSLEHEVTWTSGRSWAQLGGTTVRLKISLRDADLYSLQQR